MRLISNIQVHGPQAADLLTSLGLGGIRQTFRETVAPGTPMATLHRMTQMLEELTAYPAKRSMVNSLLIWEGGLIEAMAIDLTSDKPIGLHLWRSFHDQFVEYLGSTQARFIIADNPDVEYQESDGSFLAAEYLSLWGSDVHVYDTLDDPEAKALILGWFRRGEVTGLAHTIEDDKIRLGTAV